ncbi:MAG: hypothetical protein COY38_01795 [Candidatus Aenigmarchaeota archaeon CG_4_10_14_0_8_um_filter_37_24]|nr:hypothetical protein [Candidatus Aenigmarchaeota archaeon]OIN88649.1 MAG: hypothetical protein AUJ50_00030 [Candidatus Aenigmarchaeota archaeon CG1_02_38_14]PIV68451.1 MAG: hypothetical protein COS07_04080 [Candidatus Aenigmarchaeota archaeon CG01_land_8_20_14_3_00_37_9]PIW40794.1 MAG: hypothetical protein COW21_05385 [Candidatus Aenigmarchaeota archaeon CG15_BIG_FIL_POST_REV_8_21_14_020_37_27]PIX50622.1 MAG: hypothetical protein COZ52_03355 [Candidatus Aenigmarchaeota archaeon CG_4_8_14_3_u
MTGTKVSPQLAADVVKICVVPFGFSHELGNPLQPGSGYPYRTDERGLWGHYEGEDRYTNRTFSEGPSEYFPKFEDRVLRPLVAAVRGCYDPTQLEQLRQFDVHWGSKGLFLTSDPQQAGSQGAVFIDPSDYDAFRRRLANPSVPYWNEVRDQVLAGTDSRNPLRKLVE